jgi:integrase
MRTALNWAVKQKLIPECPEFPSVKPPRRKPQPVPVESFERLLAKSPDANTRTFLLSGWLAGLRLAEAYALRWEESDEAPYLDLDRERIVFPAGFVKGCEDQWVPLDRELREALLALPRHGKKVFRFVDRDTGLLLKDVSVGRYISKLARKAGVKLTMKSLRRGFGCYWAARVPAQVLQKIMRHSNIRITMDYYANVDDAVMVAMLGRRRPGDADSRNSSRNSGVSGATNSTPEDSTKSSGERT